jgi:hypothetical protein
MAVVARLGSATPSSAALPPSFDDVFFEAARADIGPNGARTVEDNVRLVLENPG